MNEALFPCSNVAAKVSGDVYCFAIWTHSLYMTSFFKNWTIYYAEHLACIGLCVCETPCKLALPDTSFFLNSLSI